MEIKDLRVSFHTDDGTVHAVNGVSYKLEKGEVLGIVGESGCGKSVHALSIMRLISIPPGRIDSGEVLFYGKDLLKLELDELRQVRGGQIAMVFQDPMTSLNPAYTVGFQIMEALTLHKKMDQKSGEGAQRGTAVAGGHPRRKTTPGRLPSPVFRRYAAAGDDRHGPVL